jgi:hypothetical protein
MFDDMYRYRMSERMWDRTPIDPDDLNRAHYSRLDKLRLSYVFYRLLKRHNRPLSVLLAVSRGLF